MTAWLWGNTAFAEISESTALAQADRKFIESAVTGSLKEVTISQDVLAVLQDSNIRNFAEMIVRDHGAANIELAELAGRKGVIVPVPDTKIDDKWSPKTKSVDKDYIKLMVNDHEEAIELFEKAGKSTDPAIAAFAQATLPTLQRHLALAKHLKRKVQ